MLSGFIDTQHTIPPNDSKEDFDSHRSRMALAARVRDAHASMAARSCRNWIHGRRCTANSPDKIDRRVKYRVDQVIRQLALDRRLGRKLRTILKPIGFSGGWLEYFLVGRYGRGGHFSAHRDDIFTVIEDRKWSLVCPLNEPEDYRGGILVFPELKISLRPKAGTAIIFSAHLLHGLMPVRSGHRFVLTTFARKN